jgi:acetylglutamate kinase
MMVSVIKVGGNVIDDKAALADFLKFFAAIEGPKILVHGGGKIAAAIGSKLGIAAEYVNGRRVTGAATLEVVTMVYGGLINKQIVAGLQAHGCNAIGLTGADAGVITAVKRPVKEVDYGFVGDIKQHGVRADKIAALVAAGMTPVFAPLTYDGNGGLLNTNADTIAQEVAKALATMMPVQLIYCFEKRGVLADPDDDSSVIATIDMSSFATKKENGTISGGMIPKLENAFAAIADGVERVIIGSAGELPAIIKGDGGTCIK